MSIAWSDGHETGIYSYGYLRDLCPCGVCTGAGTEHRADGPPGPGEESPR